MPEATALAPLSAPGVHCLLRTRNEVAEGLGDGPCCQPEKEEGPVVQGPLLTEGWVAVVELLKAEEHERQHEQSSEHPRQGMQREEQPGVAEIVTPASESPRPPGFWRRGFLGWRSEPSCVCPEVPDRGTQVG